MSRIVLSVIALSSLLACKEAPPAAQPSAPAQPAAPSSQPSAASGASEWGTGSVHRGASFTAAEEIALADVLAAPDKYLGQSLKTRGVVARACSKKGCWMELQPEGGDRGVRVTFKDYAFFVPLDSAGAKATIEGVLEMKKLSKEDAAHLEGEGAKITRDATGDAIEVAVVASGVELRRTPN